MTRRSGLGVGGVALVVALAGAGCTSSSPSSEPPPSAASASTSTRPPDCAPTGVDVRRDVRYAESPGVAPRRQSLDLYLPRRAAGCPPVPLVAYVHGGAFRVGDKRNRILDKVALFTGAGWAFASLNYRLVDRPGAGPTNGVYPAAEEDIAAGVAHLVDGAREYGIDRSHVMLLGHSAGAHLVALVSTDGSFLQREGLGLDDIACTVPLDTTYDIPTQIAGGGVVAAMYATAFPGGQDVYERGSPNRNVAAGKDIPAFQIVTRGQPERVADAEAFGVALRDAGVHADVRDVNPLSHAGVNDAVRTGDTVVGEPLMGFLRSCVAER